MSMYLLRQKADTINHEVRGVQNMFAQTYIVSAVEYARNRLDDIVALEKRRDTAKAKRFFAEVNLLQSRIDAAYGHAERLLNDAESEVINTLKREM